ncbi:MAG: discoidin domain-containing protein [Kiritimatiellia bacterium]
MAQNQMLVYWPLQRSRAISTCWRSAATLSRRTPLRRRHAEALLERGRRHLSGAISLFGLDAIGTTADGRSSPNHLHYHYTSGMVFALMMLGHDSYAGVRTPGYADAALGIVSYYDQYYQKKLQKETGKPLDAAGRLVIYPSDGCEPYHGCVNNLDVLAGLRALTRDLLDTPPGVLDPAKQAYLKEFEKRIPDYKFEEKEGLKLYAAADKPPEWIFTNKNMDFPQMYICFPFNAVSLGRSDMAVVRNTWELGPVNPQVQHQNQCWYQNSINLARMGDTMMAARLTLEKLLHPGLRFPAFYYTSYIGGGSFCHPPDTDHGGVAMTALQEMLMQTDGRRILLGPAWPREWSCDFKLHAPCATTVEGRVEDGKVVVDRVTPESRRADIEVFPLKTGVMPRALSQGCAATASSNYNVAGYEPARAVDGEPGTRWASASEARSGWLAIDLGVETEVGRVLLSEIEWPEVREFTIEIKQGEAWKEVARGTTIGREKTLAFPPVRAREIRLNVQSSVQPININEFQVFGP